MIEQYLQVALEFVKEIWFQLDSKFGLEETEAFKFIQPYLLQLQDNPTYMGIAFAALFLVPYGLYKVRSIARERERKLDELMEEMEEEEEDYDEDDPRRQRRPEPPEEENTIISKDDYEIEEEGDKPLFNKEDEDPPPYMQILEKLDEEEHEDELHVDTKKVMGDDDEFELEPISSELAEPDKNKDLSEFEEFEFDGDTAETEESSHDQAIQELQKEGELLELDGELSADDPFAHYSELDDDEQDRAIQALQDEMESTINKLTEQLESTPENTSSMKDLGDIKIGDGATIDDEYVLEEETEEPAFSEINEPETHSLDLTEEVEPTLKSIEPVIEELPPLQPIPERDYSHEGSSSGEADSLINRLKYFQENLDSRFHHGDKRELNPLPASKPKDLAGEHRFVEQRSFPTKSPSVPVDNKKYMETLESFIFLKDQNKH